MSVHILEVFPSVQGWGVRDAGAPPIAMFPGLDQAERRARWIAVRQAVRGQDVEIQIFDAEGQVIGRWIDERYLASPAALRRAA